MILAVGPFTALPPMMGDTAMTGTPLARIAVAQAGNGQDRIDAEPRVGRADDDAGKRRSGQRCSDLRAGPGRAAPS